VPSLVHQSLHAVVSSVKHVSDALAANLDFDRCSRVLICTCAHFVDPCDSVPDAHVRVDDVRIGTCARLRVARVFALFLDPVFAIYLERGGHAHLEELAALGLRCTHFVRLVLVQDLEAALRRECLERLFGGGHVLVPDGTRLVVRPLRE